MNCLQIAAIWNTQRDCAKSVIATNHRLSHAPENGRVTRDYEVLPVVYLLKRLFRVKKLTHVELHHELHTCTIFIASLAAMSTPRRCPSP
jgi:hypothetical protein